MVHRGRKCGIVNPDEQTLKWLLAFLIKCHYQEIPTVMTRWKHLTEMKPLFESEQKRRPSMLCPHPFRTYPADAKDLPEAIYKSAYEADGDTPCDKRGEADAVINAIALQLPLRKTSKLLRGLIDDDSEDETRVSKMWRSSSSSHNKLDDRPMKIEPMAVKK